MLAAGLSSSALGNLLGCHCTVAGVPAVHDAGVVGAAEDHTDADHDRQNRPGQDRLLDQLLEYHNFAPSVKSL